MVLLESAQADLVKKYSNETLEKFSLILTNEDNLVNTVGCDVHVLNEDNLIVNKNNDISFIVHQYDRFCLEYKEKISSKYNFKE